MTSRVKSFFLILRLTLNCNGEGADGGAASWPAFDEHDLQRRLACLGELYELVFGWDGCSVTLQTLCSGLARREGLFAHAAELVIEAHLVRRFNAEPDASGRPTAWLRVDPDLVTLGTRAAEDGRVSVSLTHQMLDAPLGGSASDAARTLHGCLAALWRVPAVTAALAQVGLNCPVSMAGLSCPWGASCARGSTHSLSTTRVGRRLREVLTDCNGGVEF